MFKKGNCSQILRIVGAVVALALLLNFLLPLSAQREEGVPRALAADSNSPVSEAFPDLVVSRIWEEGGKLWYEIANRGNGTAPDGHITQLYVNDKPRGFEQVTQSLAPGESAERSFPFPWGAAKGVVKVCADSLGKVDESNEQNNCHEESWPPQPDTEPPPVPTLISPANGETITDSRPTFGWSEISDPSGVSYNLDVDDSDGFSPPLVLSKRGLASSNYTLAQGEALAPGTYYWRVKAVDGSQNESAWTAPWSITVISPAGMGVAKTAEPTSAPPGGNITFALIVENTGDVELDPVTVVDTLPNGMSYLSSNPEATSHNGNVTWENIGPLARGSSRTITLVATIDADATGILVNTATVTSGELEDTGTTLVEVTTLPDTTPPPVPGLLSPADGSKTTDSRPTFDWSEVSDPSGVNYNMEVDDSNSFSSPLVLSKRGLANSKYTLIREEALVIGAYYWRVKAVDGSQNESAWTEPWSFTVEKPHVVRHRGGGGGGGARTPLKISEVAVSDITPNSANITWKTNSTSSGQVEYGTTTAYGSATPLDNSRVLSHAVTLPDLSPETTYHFRVLSKDSSGDQAVSPDYYFTTEPPPPPPPDTTPPIISELAVPKVTANSATITWKTSEPSTSQVEYGTTSDYDSLASPDGKLVTEHSVSLSGLKPDTTYHFRAKSKDGAGNEAVSLRAVLITLAAEPLAQPPAGPPTPSPSPSQPLPPLPPPPMTNWFLIGGIIVAVIGLAGLSTVLLRRS